MIIKRDTYDYASKIYYNAVYEKQDLDTELEKQPKDGYNDRLRAEKETRVKQLRAIIEALEEFKTRLGFVDGRGLILIVDRMELSQESIEDAENYLLGKKEMLAYSQKYYRHLLTCPSSDLYEGELEEYKQDVELMKAVVEAIEEFKKRLGLIPEIENSNR